MSEQFEQLKQLDQLDHLDQLMTTVVGLTLGAVGTVMGGCFAASRDTRAALVSALAPGGGEERDLEGH
jgi:hypothetical protein